MARGGTRDRPRGPGTQAPQTKQRGEVNLGKRRAAGLEVVPGRPALSDGEGDAGVVGEGGEPGEAQGDGHGNRDLSDDSEALHDVLLL